MVSREFFSPGAINIDRLGYLSTIQPGCCRPAAFSAPKGLPGGNQGGGFRVNLDRRQPPPD
jgi:hypothetical protein